MHRTQRCQIQLQWVGRRNNIVTGTRSSVPRKIPSCYSGLLLIHESECTLVKRLGTYHVL